MKKDKKTKISTNPSPQSQASNVNCQMSHKRGFSLVESLLAIFIFSLVSVLLGGAFSGFLKNYITAKSGQRTAESAQYAMNLMAKNIRNSTLGEAATGTKIRSFDNSRGFCIEYKYENNLLKVASKKPPLSNIESCMAVVFGRSDFSSMTRTGEISDVKFLGTPSTTTSVGKVMISASVQGGNASQIQTTVSLRQ